MNVLIVGGGSIGERHLRCFDQTPPSRVALCEVNAEKREEIRSLYKVERAYESVEQATSHEWDAAVICTPAHLHVEHAVTLAPVAKAFLIEKPLSTRLKEIPRLRAATEDKVVGIAFVRRESPVVHAVKNLINSGELGELLEVTGVSGQHFPTYRPAYREIYYARHETGGGAIQDAVTYSVNLVHWVAGPFDSVFCNYAHQALEGVDVEDTVHLVARASQGRVLVSITLNQFQAPNELLFDFYCKHGSVRFVAPDERYGVLRHGEEDWTWQEVPKLEIDDFFRRQARRFLDVCAGKASVRCTIDDAEHTLKICLAALESNGERKIVIE